MQVIKWYSKQDERWKDLLCSKVSAAAFIKYNFIKEYEWLVLLQLNTKHCAYEWIY